MPDTEDQTQAGHMQGKHRSCCIIALAPAEDRLDYTNVYLVLLTYFTLTGSLFSVGKGSALHILISKIPSM